MSVSETMSISPFNTIKASGGSENTFTGPHGPAYRIFPDAIGRWGAMEYYEMEGCISKDGKVVALPKVSMRSSGVSSYKGIMEVWYTDTPNDISTYQIYQPFTEYTNIPRSYNNNWYGNVIVKYNITKTTYTYLIIGSNISYCIDRPGFRASTSSEGMEILKGLFLVSFNNAETNTYLSKQYPLDYATTDVVGTWPYAAWWDSRAVTVDTDSFAQKIINRDPSLDYRSSIFTYLGEPVVADDSTLDSKVITSLTSAPKVQTSGSYSGLFETDQYYTVNAVGLFTVGPFMFGFTSNPYSFTSGAKENAFKAVGAEDGAVVNQLAIYDTYSGRLRLLRNMFLPMYITNKYFTSLTFPPCFSYLPTNKTFFRWQSDLLGSGTHIKGTNDFMCIALVRGWDDHNRIPSYVFKPFKFNKDTLLCTTPAKFFHLNLPVKVHTLGSTDDFCYCSSPSEGVFYLYSPCEMGADQVEVHLTEITVVNYKNPDPSTWYVKYRHKLIEVMPEGNYYSTDGQTIRPAGNYTTLVLTSYQGRSAILLDFLGTGATDWYTSYDNCRVPSNDRATLEVVNGHIIANSFNAFNDTDDFRTYSQYRAGERYLINMGNGYNEVYEAPFQEAPPNVTVMNQKPAGYQYGALEWYFPEAYVADLYTGLPDHGFSVEIGLNDYNAIATSGVRMDVHLRLDATVPINVLDVTSETGNLTNRITVLNLGTSGTVVYYNGTELYNWAKSADPYSKDRVFLIINPVERVAKVYITTDGDYNFDTFVVPYLGMPVAYCLYEKISNIMAIYDATWYPLNGPDPYFV